jgi:hypothetical protein
LLFARTIAYIIDTYLRWSNWVASRRDTIGRLQERIEQQQHDHAREIVALRGEIVIRDQQIKLMALTNEQQLGIIKRNIAVLAREQAEAEAPKVQ